MRVAGRCAAASIDRFIRSGPWSDDESFIEVGRHSIRFRCPNAVFRLSFDPGRSQPRKKPEEKTGVVVTGNYLALTLTLAHR